VGSLPHDEAPAAADFVLASADVPYLPQLPNLDPAEAVLEQWAGGLCSGGGDRGMMAGSPAHREEAFGGAAEMMARLPLDTAELKIQATGPITAAAALRASGHPHPGIWDCVAGGLVDRIKEHVMWVRTRLPATEVTLVLDEPALAAVGAGGGDERRALAVLREVMGAIPVATGLHCCGDADWAAIGRLRPAALSLNAAVLGPRFVDGASSLAEAVSEGCRMIWGAVPADPPPLPPVDLLVGRVRRAEGTLVLAGADIRRLDRAWVTPACGLSGVAVDQAEAVAELVRVVAGALDG
jgi:methionine synthase II (cobalamin-independent)